MTNKYLLKLAELSNENKQVLHTLGETAALSLPAHLAGEVTGRYLASKIHSPVLGNISQSAVGHTFGLAADAIAIKHSLHGKIPEGVNNKELT